MTKNMGRIDRVIRALVGVALIAWGVTSSNWIGAIGVIPLLTAVVGSCPAYLPFGWRTGGASPQDQ